MAKEKSKRCGFGKCKFYNKHNKVSGCKLYSDRNDCRESLKRKKKTAKKSMQNEEK